MDNQDLAAEKAVLAGVCRHGYDGYSDIADIVNAKTFTLEINQVIFKCLKKVFDADMDAKIDSSSILSAAKDMGYTTYFSHPEQSKHLRSVLGTPVELTTVRRLAAKIRKLEIGRRLISDVLDKSKSDLVKVTGEESLTHILGLVESPLFGFMDNVFDDGTEPFLLGDKVDDFLAAIEANPDASIGVPTGYPIYDDIIGGGLRRKSVSIIGARAKAGKTFFGMNVANNVTSKLNIPCLYLDTEMSHEEQLGRILSLISGKVPYRHIENGSYLKDQYKHKMITEAKGELKRRRLHYLSIPGQAFEETLAVMRRWVKKSVGVDKNGRTNDCLIVLDYFKVMDSSSITQLMSEYQVLGFMLTAMQAFASRFDVPILTFIQLNRDGLDKENEAAASGSDRITWFCSNFSIFKRKAIEEIADDGGPKVGNRKLVPVICRHGAGLEEGDYINMFADLDYSRIVEGKTRNQLKAEKPPEEPEDAPGIDEDDKVVF